jgi:hypothetical protein
MILTEFERSREILIPRPIDRISWTRFEALKLITPSEIISKENIKINGKEFLLYKTLIVSVLNINIDPSNVFGNNMKIPMAKRIATIVEKSLKNPPNV